MTKSLMYSIDIRLQARAKPQLARQRMTLNEAEYTILQLTLDQQATAMTVSFEMAVERLRQLPRMFIEPDGAFVWVSQNDEPTWQLEGCLYDRGNRMMYVDVAGTCPAEQFDQLLAAFGWPESGFVFQLRQHAVYMEEFEWRRYAAAGMEAM
jgi:hypothetical protein